MTDWPEKVKMYWGRQQAMEAASQREAYEQMKRQEAIRKARDEARKKEDSKKLFIFSMMIDGSLFEALVVGPASPSGTACEVKVIEVLLHGPNNRYMTGDTIVAELDCLASVIY